MHFTITAHSCRISLMTSNNTPTFLIAIDEPGAACASGHFTGVNFAEATAAEQGNLDDVAPFYPARFLDPRYAPGRFVALVFCGGQELDRGLHLGDY